VGQSSGAALWASIRSAPELEEGVVVMVFPDFGDRYLSTNLWAGWQEWQKRHGRT
jgi:cysteine synthase